MTLDEIAILRTRAEDRSKETIKWAYPLRAKSKKTTPCPKPPRARVNKSTQTEWQIGSEPFKQPYCPGSIFSADRRAEWRAALAKRLPKRLTPSRLVEQVITQNSNGVLNDQDLVRMAELCDKLGGRADQIASIIALKK